jgi:hypothetical protein
VHYALDSPIADTEWNATLPSGGATIRLGPGKHVFTVSIFHEMRCLNIIRESLVKAHADPSSRPVIRNDALIRHCMNYVRQMILCRANTRLEPVRANTGMGIAMSEVTHTCLDWSAVYEAAELNRREYLAGNNDGRKV